MEKTEELETKKILPLILKYSIPAIVGMFISAVYNITDRIFIGNSIASGELGLARNKYNFSYIYFNNGNCFLDWNRRGCIIFNFIRKKK